MTTDLQDKKFEYVFTWFDQNGDGWITQDDMEKISKLFSDLADDPDQKNKDLMHKGFMNWWKLLLDAREDEANEKVGKEEFIRIMHAVVIHPQNFEIAIGYIVDGLLGALDRDGSGSLSQKNTSGCITRLGSLRLPPPNLLSDLTGTAVVRSLTRNLIRPSSNTI